MTSTRSVANDHTPPVRELSAIERAYRAIDWTTSRIAERSGMSPDQREARAAYYEARVAMYLSMADTLPAMIEWAGLNMLAVNIMRSEKLG